MQEGRWGCGSGLSVGGWSNGNGRRRHMSVCVGGLARQLLKGGSDERGHDVGIGCGGTRPAWSAKGGAIGKEEDCRCSEE